MTVTNTHLHGAAEAAFVMTSCNDRNYTVHDAWVENVTIEGIDSFSVSPQDSSGLLCRPNARNFVQFTNFTFKNVVGIDTIQHTASFHGLRPHDFTNFTFDNFNMGEGNGTHYWRCDNVAAGDFTLRSGVSPNMSAACLGQERLSLARFA